MPSVDSIDREAKECHPDQQTSHPHSIGNFALLYLQPWIVFLKIDWNSVATFTVYCTKSKVIARHYIIHLKL